MLSYSRPAILCAVVLALAGTSALHAAGQVVPDQYIVMLKPDVDKGQGFADRMAAEHGGAVVHDFATVHGFAVRVPLARLGRLLGDPRVAKVEADGLAHTFDVQATGKPGGGGGGTTQPAQVLPTGVDRIDAERNANEGAGIRVAVVDTGIELAHPDLAANVKGNVSFIAGTRSGNDDNGHGTHVAGTIAALDNAIGVVGVASQASLYSVKVLDRSGSGSYSGIIKGIEWCTANGIQVANMSLGGSVSSDALHTALLNAKAAGLTVVVAAGNEAMDANFAYPAAYDDAVITVSALDPVTDTFASFSNFGVPPIDVAGPGVAILSTYKGGGYRSLSGTSMATPHVAGAAALIIKSRLALGLSATCDDVKARLLETAVPVGGNTPQHVEPLVAAGGL